MENKRHTHEFFLTAAEVNAQREMPLSRLVTTVIDVATAHANILGIGFDRMIREGISWVLSRLTIELEAMPAVNRNYRMTTWIENANRLFSDRNFELADAATGEVLARISSTWMAVDMATRRPGDLTPIWQGRDIIDGSPINVSKAAKLLPLQPESGERSLSYRFAVSDIDVNRHVTTRRYIDLITDLWPLSHYDSHRISRFEVAFKHEARYDETATAACAPHEGSPEVADVEISVGQTPCCLARLTFREREPLIN